MADYTAPLIMWGLFLFALILIFPRQFHNLYVLLGRNSRKQYVIVYQKAAHTDFYFKWLIVPHPDFITKVGKARHDLHDDMALFKYQGRNYFWTNEADTIPHKLSDETMKMPHELLVTALQAGQFSFNIKERTDDEILIVADRTNAAFENNVSDALYRKTKNLLLIGFIALLIISLIVIIYNITVIREVQPLVQVIYDKVQPQNITINGR